MMFFGDECLAQVLRSHSQTSYVVEHAAFSHICRINVTKPVSTTLLLTLWPASPLLISSLYLLFLFAVFFLSKALGPRHKSVGLPNFPSSSGGDPVLQGLYTPTIYMGLHFTCGKG